MLQEKWQIIGRGGKKYFVTYVPFLQGRIHVIKYFDYDRIYRTLWRSATIIFAGMFAAFILAALLSIKLINVVFKRLDKLTEAVKDAEAGNYRVQVDSGLLKVNDEAGVLARHFQNLMEQIDDLINQKLKRQLSEVQAQNQMLQAQIRPHFLYNTLETVHAMAVRNGNSQIARIVISLSRLVRASYRGDALVSLQEEIGFVREYLTIYRIRFGNRLDAQISYDAEDDRFFLPRMTLQPMIENSVQYGVMKKTEKGLIRLGVYRRGYRIVISLFDNGIGFTQEQIEYYEHLSMENIREIHGLANVLVPLRLASALAVALVLTTNHKGISLYRTVYYVPSLLGGSVAIAIIWARIFGSNGAFNGILSVFSGTVFSFNWVGEISTALYSLILLGCWHFGSSMLIFVSGIKQIPASYYEAALLDGANSWQKFRYITLPALSPVIFFNLVQGIINAFKAFSEALIITDGGPLNSTMLFALYIYKQGFSYFKMGYACAMSWVLLVIISIFSIFVFKSSDSWVHYES